MWVLAACAGCSTRSKGSQQALRLSHPVRVARNFSRKGWWLFFKDGSGQGQGRAGPGQAGQGQAGICQPGAPNFLGVPQTPRTDQHHVNGQGFGVLLYCLTAERSTAGLGHCGPCRPGTFTRRSDGTLGRGPRSEPRAPMQMVRRALGSLGNLTGILREGFLLPPMP